MNISAIAQIDTIAGNIDFNKNKIISCIKKAQQCSKMQEQLKTSAAQDECRNIKNADLIIFPAFALTGFPFGGVLKRHKSLIKKQEAALKEITAETSNITAVIGCAENGKSSAVIIQNSRIIKNTETFELNGIKYGILLNENNLEELMKNKPEIIIYCACNPSRCGSGYKINNFCSSAAEKYGVSLIYVNKSGYADGFVFDGASRIYNKSGNLTLRLKAFEEDFAVFQGLTGIINPLPEGMEEKFSLDDFELNYKNDAARTYKSIIYAVRQYFSLNGFSKAVIGLSGGLDSSVSAVLLADALGAENVTGISMPSKITSKESRTDAAVLAENLGINFFEIPLAQILDVSSEMLNSAYNNIAAERQKPSAAYENLQARTRASILWSISNEFKGMLPIASSDKSEAYIGYATVNGDMSGGFAPIADVQKTKLFILADYINKTRAVKNAIPQTVLEKPPGAELKLNPKTGKPVYAEEDNMPYEFLDEIIHLIENKGFGRNELAAHKFLHETKHPVSQAQKEEWIDKFYRKSKCAVYKWHIMPQSVIIDTHSINAAEYSQPVISKVY